MTGPSAVTVSLMDGAWKEVKRLPLGPSLSDAWWRFGGLIEVKVSSNRTKFPAVITKKIKGIAMRYEGRSKAFPSQPQHQTQKESSAVSISSKIGISGPLTLSVPEQMGQPYSSLHAHVSSGLHHSPFSLAKWCQSKTIGRKRRDCITGTHRGSESTGGSQLTTTRAKIPWKSKGSDEIMLTTSIKPEWFAIRSEVAFQSSAASMHPNYI